ncbi:hypothetical protein C6J21_001393 [Salmonella enterica subsp. enterica serovar Thompson]|uniref:hypothetical protein n=1 Tax=Salmonella enterica TaxID=28901 RepID=UPI0019A157C8|nr:hypothetical protein [Salmonella enterica]EDR6374123.1 hypothetical protein [Salmonella enterica subsp. enterica serovar Thompson]HAU2964023.1 hypothetical protein [Salmonella enterica subsp. diarizonae]EAT3714610.1 hypothetical protein [Salmonella enterica]EDU5430210.1 hypothetical protein [Salmonella enterica subsp. enterica serovar Thompson]
MIDASLIDLPWATLVTLASGYIGYFIANVGLKDHHKAIDITFATLVFSLLPTLAYALVLLTCTSLLATYISTVSAVVIAVATGAFWRKKGRKWMYLLLRKYNISWSDSTSSAWQQMFGMTDYVVTEVIVILKDGSELRSLLPGDFEAEPNGSFALGTNGDVIIYATHHRLSASKNWVEYPDVNDATLGALATWIPSGQIASLKLRRVHVDSIPDPSDS